jgi:predicted cytidylate kinase
MIITIGGTMGAGKSTLAIKLAKKLSWPRYYMGQIFRDLARKKGLVLREYLKGGESDPQIDRQVDEYQIKLGRTKDNIIIEGRTSFFLIPQSVKIYLFADLDTAAKRVFSDLKKNSRQRNEGKHETWEDVKKDLKKRLATDRKRYRRYYQRNVFNPKHFDLALDTSDLTKQQVFAEVYRFCREKMGKTRG